MTSSPLMNTYKRAPVEFVFGHGEYLYDAEKRRYIDLLSGIAVVSVGHANLRVATAISNQAQSLVHVSNLFGTLPMKQLAERLQKTTGGWGRVFFCNSGAEANECAIKLARKNGSAKKKYKILAAEGGFHGRTMGTLSATGQPEKWRGFEPLLEGFVHRPFNDLAAFAEALDDSVAGIMVEPIQGERGVIPATPEFLRGLRDLCTRADIPLIFDEVQTGIGRTGQWWAFQHFGVKPDIMTSAKGIANGMPLGACIADEPFASAFNPGDHGTTFGGNPVACAAALATLDEVQDRNLAGEATRKGELLRERLLDIDDVQEVRGAGLMLGVVLKRPIALSLVPAALERGLIINATSDSVIRLVPPLVITDHALEEAVEIFSDAILSVSEERTTVSVAGY
jgi:acetylornithine/N-succinyldiaminopimelate aminotransferase